MQPTYLPWIGYFDLIDRSTVFAFLDNVQFSKQSWQQRNRIRTAKGLEWLTVPVLMKGKGRQLINEVQINPKTHFVRDHLRSIELSYGRSRFLNDYISEFKGILLSGESSLATLNVSLIKWLSHALGINSQFELSSQLGACGKRSSLLVDICKRLGANTYLSPLGSSCYLMSEKEVFDQNGIEVVFQNYDHPTYRQLYEPFFGYAATIDLLFNEGPASVEIVRSGSRPHISIEELRKRKNERADNALLADQPA